MIIISITTTTTGRTHEESGSGADSPRPGSQLSSLLEPVCELQEQDTVWTLEATCIWMREWEREKQNKKKPTKNQPWMREWEREKQNKKKPTKNQP